MRSNVARRQPETKPASSPASRPYRIEEQVGYLLRRAHQRASSIFQVTIGDPNITPTQYSSMVAAHDVGKAINPTLVEGQIEGGIAQGLGLALMEEYLPGRTENLHDYLIPTIGDVPEIECILIEDREPLGPSGAKGVGEPGLVPTAPAILGAVHHATGIRAKRVPLLPHRLREAIVNSWWWRHGVLRRRKAGRW